MYLLLGRSHLLGLGLLFVHDGLCCGLDFRVSVTRGENLCKVLCVNVKSMGCGVECCCRRMHNARWQLQSYRPVPSSDAVGQHQETTRVYEAPQQLPARLDDPCPATGVLKGDDTPFQVPSPEHNNGTHEVYLLPRS